MKDLVNLEMAELSFLEKLTLRFSPYLNRFPIFNEETIEELAHYGFLRSNGCYSNGRYRIKRTLSGNMYFRYKRKHTLMFFIPLIISTLALLESYDILHVSIVYDTLLTAASLVKTMLGN